MTRKISAESWKVAVFELPLSQRMTLSLSSLLKGIR